MELRCTGAYVRRNHLNHDESVSLLSTVLVQSRRKNLEHRIR